MFLVEPVQGKGVQPAAGRLPRGRAGALPPLRHALLRRRGADRLRAHREAVRVRALGPRARPRAGREVALGRLRAGRRAADVDARCTRRVFDSMENAFSHGSTFAPNELAMAAGLATLHELDEQGLVERSARLGARLLELTRPLVERHDVVREVRGLGLMWAIEFAEPPRRAAARTGCSSGCSRALRAARRRAALPRPPDPDPGRRPRHAGDQGAAAARRHRRGHRVVRRVARATIRKAQRIPTSLTRLALARRRRALGAARGSQRKWKIATSRPPMPQAAITARSSRLRPDRVAAQVDRVHEVDEVLQRQHVADRAEERRDSAASARTRR